MNCLLVALCALGAEAHYVDTSLDFDGELLSWTLQDVEADERRELIVAVHSAIGELKDEHKEALRLHYLEGRTVAETAQEMKRSDGAVVMLCNRALRQLAKIMGNRFDFSSHDT